MNHMDMERAKKAREAERIRQDYLAREFGWASRLIAAIALVLLALILSSVLDNQYGMLPR
jgi:carbon starvation protein CstA